MPGKKITFVILIITLFLIVRNLISKQQSQPVSKSDSACQAKPSVHQDKKEVSSTGPVFDCS